MVAGDRAGEVVHPSGMIAEEDVNDYTFATGGIGGGFGVSAIIIIRSLLTLRTGGGIIIVRI